MIALWIVSSGTLAFFAIVLHTLATRWMDPKAPGNSMKRFWLLFVARLLLIALFFWQLVQQGIATLIICLIVFLAVYAGSLYYIIKKKPQWFQPEFKKEVPAWKL